MARRRHRRNPNVGGGHVWTLTYEGFVRRGSEHFHRVNVRCQQLRDAAGRGDPGARAMLQVYRRRAAAVDGDTVEEALTWAVENVQSIDPNATFVTEGF